jgi:hypothetical protein
MWSADSGSGENMSLLASCEALREENVTGEKNDDFGDPRRNHAMNMPEV